MQERQSAVEKLQKELTSHQTLVTALQSRLAAIVRLTRAYVEACWPTLRLARSLSHLDVTRVVPAVRNGGGRTHERNVDGLGF